MTTAITDEERAIRVARVAAGLAAFGLLFDAITSRTIGASWLQFAAVPVCGAIWIWLLLSRRRPSLTRGTIAFLIVNAVILVALWASTQRIVERGTSWVPFRPHQLGAFTVALLAPPRAWVGIVTIIGFVGAAVLQFALFTPSTREHLAYGDQWATLAYGGFAIAILLHRLRATRIERYVAHAQAEAESFELFARAMVALRDLSNTPLQTIWNTVELLRMRDARSRELADRLEHALHQLVELEELTRPYERQLHWQTGDEAWDPKAILQVIARRTTSQP